VKIPTALLRDVMSVEPYEGESAYGPVFGAAVDVRARVEGKRRLVRRPGGDDLIASATAFIRPESSVPEQSRVTFDARTYVVVDVLDAKDLTGICHREVLLS
jgi:hypothetical protein